MNFSCLSPSPNPLKLQVLLHKFWEIRKEKTAIERFQCVFERQNANEIMTADGRKLPPCVCVSGERYRDGRMLMIEIQFILPNLKKHKLGTTDCGSRQRRSIQKRVVGCLCSTQLSPHLPPPAPLCHPTQPQTSPTYLPSIENGLHSMYPEMYTYIHFWRNVSSNLQAQGHQEGIPGGTVIKE